MVSFVLLLSPVGGRDLLVVFNSTDRMTSLSTPPSLRDCKRPVEPKAGKSSEFWGFWPFMLKDFLILSRDELLSSLEGGCFVFNHGARDGVVLGECVDADNFSGVMRVLADGENTNLKNGVLRFLILEMLKLWKVILMWALVNRLECNGSLDLVMGSSSSCGDIILFDYIHLKRDTPKRKWEDVNPMYDGFLFEVPNKEEPKVFVKMPLLEMRSKFEDNWFFQFLVGGVAIQGRLGFRSDNEENGNGELVDSSSEFNNLRNSVIKTFDQANFAGVNTSCKDGGYSVVHQLYDKVSHRRVEMLLPLRRNSYAGFFRTKLMMLFSQELLDLARQHFTKMEVDMGGFLSCSRDGERRFSPPDKDNTAGVYTCCRDGWNKRIGAVYQLFDRVSKRNAIILWALRQNNYAGFVQINMMMVFSHELLGLASQPLVVAGMNTYGSWNVGMFQRSTSGVLSAWRYMHQGSGNLQLMYGLRDEGDLDVTIMIGMEHIVSKYIDGINEVHRAWVGLRMQAASPGQVWQVMAFGPGILENEHVIVTIGVDREATLTVPVKA